MNRIELQPRDERRSGAGLRGDPRRRAVVDDVQGVLDVPLGREDERLDGGARRQTRSAVCVVIECSQVRRSGPVTVRTARLREVDDGEALLEQPLLAHRVAVVRRDPGVDPVGRDRTGRGQQG